MELPGIEKKRILELEPKIQKVVRRHIRNFKKILKEKEKILEDKDPREEILGFGGLKKMDNFIKKSEGPVQDKLIVLKSKLMKFKNLVDREITINNDLEELSKKAKNDKTLKEELERLKAEFADEMILGTLISRQLGLISEIHKSVTQIIPMLENENEIITYILELDNICMLLKDIIDRKEIETLGLIYNLLNIPGWQKLVR